MLNLTIRYYTLTYMALRFPALNLRHWLSLATLAITVLFTAYLSFFKIIDTDFWWHITAGKIMYQSRRLIAVEPFSYVRPGEPYLATHSWLAEVVMHLIHSSGGDAATIIARIILVALTFLVVLLIDWRTAWPAGALVLWSAWRLRPHFLDRPQLFTYLFFAVLLWLACYYLRRRYAMTQRQKYLLLAALVLVQFLWINMHGASTILGFLVVGSLGAQAAFDWFWGQSQLTQSRARGEILSLVIVGITLFVVSILPPNSFRSFQYLFTLATDNTTPLIREWQPRTMQAYLIDFAALWAAALAALFSTRRHWMFAGTLLTITGYLSLQSYRHGILFGLAALSVLIYELSANARFNALLDRLTAPGAWKIFFLTVRKSTATSMTTVAALILFSSYVYADDVRSLWRSGYYGFGAAPPAAGAFDFLDRVPLQGNMFNTYTIGGYAVYRSYPGRRTFVDGRNVEYGRDLLYDVQQSAGDPQIWQRLSDRFDFTYAVVEREDASRLPSLPYSSHLNNNPQWKLVYVDDTSEIYAKDLPANQSVIEQFGYQTIIPEALESGIEFEQTPGQDAARIERELKRVIADSPSGIKARIILAEYYQKYKKLDEARSLANEAVQLASWRPEVYELRGQIAYEQSQWSQAAADLERSLKLSRGEGRQINYAFLAQVFSKAGNSAKAQRYLNQHQNSQPPAP